MLNGRSSSISMHRLAVSKCLLVVLAAVIGGISSGPAEAAGPVTLAVSSFDFTDTSGETRHQADEHARRLKALGVTLQKGLSANRRLTVVPLVCGAGECTARTVGLEVLSTEARKTGARYLLIGEVRKMSTLIGSVKFAVLDLTTNKPTCDRFLSYRGDTDEAWQRAAGFAAEVIEKSCLPR